MKISLIILIFSIFSSLIAYSTYAHPKRDTAHASGSQEQLRSRDVVDEKLDQLKELNREIERNLYGDEIAPENSQNEFSSSESSDSNFEEEEKSSSIPEFADKEVEESEPEVITAFPVQLAIDYANILNEILTRGTFENTRLKLNQQRMALEYFSKLSENLALFRKQVLDNGDGRRIRLVLSYCRLFFLTTQVFNQMPVSYFQNQSAHRNRPQMENNNFEVGNALRLIEDALSQINNNSRETEREVFSALSFGKDFLISKIYDRTEMTNNGSSRGLLLAHDWVSNLTSWILVAGSEPHGITR